MFVTRFHWFLVLSCNVQAYTRKLAVHDLSFFCLGDKEGSYVTCSTRQGNKGSSEIGTCLFQHLSNAAASRVTRVTLSTRIHVHDRIGTKMLQRIEVCSRDFSISRINWPDFPWRRGHSQMECDSIHSTIERAKQSTTIFLPSQWHPVVQMARKSSSYDVFSLTHDIFLDFKEFEKSKLGNTQTDIDLPARKPGNWLKLKWIRYLKEPDSLLLAVTGCLTNSDRSSLKKINGDNSWLNNHKWLKLCRHTKVPSPQLRSVWKQERFFIRRA